MRRGGEDKVKVRSWRQVADRNDVSMGDVVTSFGHVVAFDDDLIVDKYWRRTIECTR